jgi:hypothetical protein
MHDAASRRKVITRIAKVPSGAIFLLLLIFPAYSAAAADAPIPLRYAQA